MTMGAYLCQFRMYRFAFYPKTVGPPRGYMFVLLNVPCRHFLRSWNDTHVGFECMRQIQPSYKAADMNTPPPSPPAGWALRMDAILYLGRLPDVVTPGKPTPSQPRRVSRVHAGSNERRVPRAGGGEIRFSSLELIHNILLPSPLPLNALPLTNPPPPNRRNGFRTWFVWWSFGSVTDVTLHNNVPVIPAKPSSNKSDYNGFRGWLRLILQLCPVQPNPVTIPPPRSVVV